MLVGSWGGALASSSRCWTRPVPAADLVATATGPQTMVQPNPLPPVKNLILRRWGDLSEEARKPTCTG